MFGSSVLTVNGLEKIKRESKNDRTITLLRWCKHMHASSSRFLLKLWCHYICATFFCLNRQQQFLEFINIVENGNDRATSSASAGSKQKLLDKNLGAKSRFQSDKAHQKQLEYLAAKMKNHRSPFTARKNKIKNARESPSENSEKCSAFTPYKVADAEHTTITANSHLSAFTSEEELSDDSAGKVDMRGTKSKKRKQMRHSERAMATATRGKEIKIHLSGGPPRRKKRQKHKRKPKKKKGNGFDTMTLPSPTHIPVISSLLRPVGTVACMP